MPLKGQIFTFWKLMVYVAKAQKKAFSKTERLSLKVVSPGISFNADLQQLKYLHYINRDK
ncbi:hypothetical protein KADA111694_00365 [Kaistella daneshvariae]